MIGNSASTLSPKRICLAVSALSIPILCIVGDLALRGSHLPRDGAATYAAGALLSLLVWGLAMEAARHPRRVVRAIAILFIGFMAAFGIGLQAVARGFTHAYLGRRALVLALGIPDLAHSSYVAHNVLRIVGVFALPAALAIGLAIARVRWFGLRSHYASMAAGVGAIAVLVTVFTPFAVQGLQCLPPDMLWLNGTGGPLLYAFGLEHKPKALPIGAHEALPIAPSVRADAPTILLIFGESVRRDAVCVARREGCDKSPRVDEAAPDRIGFGRAFSTASCTELASTALWTGLRATTPPDVFARAPLLWDWAKARGYRTAYITSQNLLFQQSDRFLRGSRIDRLREARDRVVDAPIDDGSPDEGTTAEALDFIEADTGPAFVVVHYANTHAPYRQTPGFMPNPIDDRLGRYRNSLVQNDAVVGDLIRKLRQSARGQRTIVLYTSDHGEAWGEHGAYYHSFDLYSEQIDIPFWIDAPRGSLSDETLDRLRRDAPKRPVALGDLTATLIDLFGALDLPELRGRAAALYGTSLLRDAPAKRDVLLWNCPLTRECPNDAFGVVSFPRELHYVGHEQRYVCDDLDADPTGAASLPTSDCADLFSTLDREFGARAPR